MSLPMLVVSKCGKDSRIGLNYSYLDYILFYIRIVINEGLSMTSPVPDTAETIELSDAERLDLLVHVVLDIVEEELGAERAS